MYQLHDRAAEDIQRLGQGRSGEREDVRTGSEGPVVAISTDDRGQQPATPLLADAARFARHSPGDRWFVDETYVKVAGVWRYVERAVDQHGQVIDVLLSRHRDAAAARRFFSRALRTLKVTPSEVVTDAAPVYPGVLEELLPAAWHHVEQYANNPDRSRSQPAQTEASTDARPTN
jgi:transposase-like protein